MEVEGLVEGVTDRFVLEKILASRGAKLSQCFGLVGCNYIRQKIHGFSIRAKHGLPLIVLADLMDFEGSCGPNALSNLNVELHDRIAFRFVVQEIESWLLADPEGLASFLRVSPALIPSEPDDLSDPKRVLVDLARKGRSRWAKELVPREGLSGVVGEGYVGAIAEFVARTWDVERAAGQSDSLVRALKSIDSLLAR